MKRFLKIALLFALGIFFGLNAAGVAHAADCIPQDATPTTYMEIDNPDYVPAVPAVDPIPAVTHTETVVDSEAYDEQVLVTAEYTIDHEAVTHVVHHDAVTHTEWEYVQFITGKTKWQNSPTWNAEWNEHSIGWFLTGNTRCVTDVEAWDETVVDQEAYTETVPAVYTTVHHDAVTHEVTVVDQEAVEGSPEIPAVGEPTVTVVSHEGTDAVVCEEEPTEEPTPTETPTEEPTAVPVATEVTPAPVVVSEVYTPADKPSELDSSLAETGANNVAMVGGFAAALLALGISAMVIRHRSAKQH